MHLVIPTVLRPVENKTKGCPDSTDSGDGNIVAKMENSFERITVHMTVVHVVVQNFSL